MALDATGCTHTNVRCLNQYELIRKYQCSSCDAVLMCSCEEEVGRKFLPHQLATASVGGTQRVPVTLGFVSGVCNRCRGIPEDAHPKSPRYGRTSKIRRYYWRELQFESMRRFGDWADQQGRLDWSAARSDYPEQYAEIERQALEDIKALHEKSPKYKYSEESQARVISDNNVCVERLDAFYVNTGGRRASVLDGKEAVSVEEFATRHYQRLDYEVVPLESRPLHALFAIFMWLLIQDHLDPHVRTVGIGARPGQANTKDMLWFALPDDFGTEEYSKRRAEAIEDHWATLKEDRDELLWLFDYWVDPSASLRQYLHVWEDKYARQARCLVENLPPKTIVNILKYLVSGYWSHYCGWPDLFLYRGNDWLLAEVKSSSDRLSEDQKRWIRDNRQVLGLPFRLVKIHRKN